MKPDDAPGLLPPDRRPFRVLIIAGSNRHQYNCPGVDGKARTRAWRVADRLPQDWEIDLEDLGKRVWPRPHSELQCVSPRRWSSASGRATATTPAMRRSPT